MRETGLEALREEIATCMRCGNCQAVCPVYRQVRREPAVARGKVALAAALLSGELEPDAEVARQLDLCLSCNACTDACPSGVRVDDVILAARAEVVRRRGLDWFRAAIFAAVKRPRVLSAGVATAAKLQGLALAPGPEARLGVVRLPVPGARRAILPRLPSRPLRGGEEREGHARLDRRVAFYPGCMVTYVYPEIGRALVDVLRAAGVEAVLPAEDRCCGIPLLLHGDEDGARAMARAVVATLDALGGEAVLTACPTCGSALKRQIPRLLAGDRLWAARAERLAARALDATEYLASAVDLPEAGAAGVRATYHDPCHLARGQGVRSQPRALIMRVAGLELAELGSPETCCGGAGSFLLTHPELAARIGAQKTSEIDATGAEIVVTSCPGCRMQLTDSLRRHGLTHEVRHTVEVLAKAIVNSE